MNRPIHLTFALLLVFELAACSVVEDDFGESSGAAGSLSVSAGFWNKTAVECGPAQANVPLAEVLLSTGSGVSVTVEQIAFHVSGTMNESADILNVTLAEDLNGDGLYTPGTDAVVVTGTHVFDGDDGSVVFAPNKTLLPSATESWIVSADFGGSAGGGESCQVTLDPSVDVTARRAGSSEAVVVSGGVVTGAQVTVPAQPLAWNQIAPSGSAPVRYGHAAVYDPGNGRMVVHAGTDGTTLHADVHALDLTAGSETWAAVSPSGTAPSARNQHAAALDPVNHRMIVFGGANATSVMNDLWFLDLSNGSESWTQPAVSGSAPSARYGARAVYLFGGNRMVICGGNNGAATNPNLGDFHDLDLSGGTAAWSPRSVNGPSGYGQSGHVGFHDSAGTRVLLFGGQVNPNVSSNRLYRLDLSATPGTVADLQLPGGPFPASYCAGAQDTSAGRFYVFSGFDTSRNVSLSDLFAFEPSPSPGRWVYIMTQGTAPASRAWATMVHDSGNGRMVLYGGEHYNGAIWQALSDVWELK